METKTKKNNQIENPCMVCGKEVKWGQDGCPVVDKGNEIGVLLGNWVGMKHYRCECENKFKPDEVYSDE